MASSYGLGTKEISAAMRHLLSFVPHSTELKIRFLGVMPFDFFPLSTFTASSFSDSMRTPSAPGLHAICCIVNTDPSTKPGKHWVAFFLGPHGKLEFFDSYGRPPTHFGFPIACSMLDTSTFEYNTLAIQADSSSVCGHYCIVFLFLRCLLAVHSTCQAFNLRTSNTPLKSISSFLFALAPTAHVRDKEIKHTIKKLQLSLHKPRQTSCVHFLLSPNHACFEQSCSSAFCASLDS